MKLFMHKIIYIQYTINLFYSETIKTHVRRMNKCSEFNFLEKEIKTKYVLRYFSSFIFKRYVMRLLAVNRRNNL